MAVPKSGKERPGKADEIAAKGSVKAEGGNCLELGNPWVELADSWNQIRCSLPFFPTDISYESAEAQAWGARRDLDRHPSHENRTVEVFFPFFHDATSRHVRNMSMEGP